MPVRVNQLMIIVATVLLLSACRPLSLYWIKPEGPAEYQLGWQDGCDTGLSAQSGMFFKARYGFKKRPEMGANDLYKQGWNEGFTYCRFTLSRSQDEDSEINGSSQGIFSVLR